MPPPALYLSPLQSLIPVAIPLCNRNHHRSQIIDPKSSPSQPLESASGKSYDVVGLAAQEPKATVFRSTTANSKIVGKITRRVSFVHYLEASEVPKDDTKKLKQLYERSLTNSGHHFMTATTTKSIRSRQLVSASGGRASTHSSGHKSSRSEEKNSMRKHVIEVSMSSQDSGQEKKAKKRKKHVA